MRKAFAICIFPLAVSLAFGQSSVSAGAQKPSDQTALIQELLQRIDRMEKRIFELEAKSGPSTAAAPATAPAEPPPLDAAVAKPAVHDHEATMASEDETYPKLTIRGFADIQFAVQNLNNGAGSRSGFQTGQFILHFSSPLSRKIKYFGEVSISQIPQGIFLNLERSIIRYDYNDNFKLSFGQFHSPTSYYNTAFHHGGWLQTTIARPAPIDYFSGPLPQHVLGMAAEGDIPSGAAGLGYIVGIGNGALGFGGGDVNNNRSFFGEIHTRPRAVSGLQVGGSIWTDKRTRNGRDYRQLISGAHIVLKNETPELIAEVSAARHTDILTGQTWTSPMGFVQVAYRLPFNEKKWKPYYLFEYISTPTDEPMFGRRKFTGSTVGMRYDISDFAAFKAEYRNQKRLINDPRLHGLFLQTTFTF